MNDYLLWFLAEFGISLHVVVHSAEGLSVELSVERFFLLRFASLSAEGLSVCSRNIIFRFLWRSAEDLACGRRIGERDCVWG